MTDQFLGRFGLARGHYRMAIPKQLKVVAMAEDRVAGDPHQFRDRDQLACFLLNLSASVYEMCVEHEDFSGLPLAGEVAARANDQLPEIEAHPFWQGRFATRPVVLRGGLYLNLAVVAFERGDLAAGRTHLSDVQALLDSVPYPERSNDLYQSLVHRLADMRLALPN